MFNLVDLKAIGLGIIMMIMVSVFSAAVAPYLIASDSTPLTVRESMPYLNQSQMMY